MKEQIKLELAKLQKELSTLENAVSQINKAGKLSSEVVQSVQGLKNKFEHGFKNLIEITEKKITEHSKLSTDKLTAAMAANKVQANDNLKTLNAFKEETSKYIKTSEEKNEKLHKSYEEQITSTNKLLENYLELAKATTKLSTTIEEVDFPQRLDKITVNIGIVNEQVRNVRADIEELPKKQEIASVEKRIKRNNRRTNLTLALVIIALILLVGISFETVFLKFFPDLIKF